MRLRIRKSIVRATPISCTSRYCPPSSGSSPKRSVALPSRAERAASRKSQASAIEKPDCSARPLTAAMVSLERSRMVVLSFCEMTRSAS